VTRVFPALALRVSGRLCYTADMKPSHAAALALVGWYLMVPPPVFHSSMPVDLDAPLSKWRIFSLQRGLVAFDKVGKDETGRKSF
jgi:hypothetical protein